MVVLQGTQKKRIHYGINYATAPLRLANMQPRGFHKMFMDSCEYIYSVFRNSFGKISGAPIRMGNIFTRN